jgi:hypothetical protein
MSASISAPALSKIVLVQLVFDLLRLVLRQTYFQAPATRCWPSILSVPNHPAMDPFSHEIALNGWGAIFSHFPFAFRCILSEDTHIDFGRFFAFGGSTLSSQNSEGPLVSRRRRWARSSDDTEEPLIFSIALAASASARKARPGLPETAAGRATSRSSLALRRPL